MVFDKKTLVIPDDTKFEEKTILTIGDVIVGNHARVDFGVLTSGRFFGGESIEIDGSVRAEGDVRVDMFGKVTGSVTSKGDVYLGEKSRIEGELRLDGDLDVGDDVHIKQGFEAKGWINIRNPIPMVVYVFIYLMELMRLGRSEEVERILAELEAQGREEIVVSDVYMYVPDGCRIGLSESDVKGNLRIGAGCRVLGNYTVKGDVLVGRETRVYGAIRCTGNVKLLEGAEVQGDLRAVGSVEIGEGCQVLGDLTGHTIEVHKSALVNGTMNAEEGVRFVTELDKEMESKVERFENNQVDDIVDLLH